MSCQLVFLLFFCCQFCKLDKSMTPKQGTTMKLPFESSYNRFMVSFITLATNKLMCNVSLNVNKNKVFNFWTVFCWYPKKKGHDFPLPWTLYGVNMSCVIGLFGTQFWSTHNSKSIGLVGLHYSHLLFTFCILIILINRLPSSLL